MNAIGVIPARWASSRFEGKVLAEIDNKPLVQHVWEGAKKSRLLDDLIVATDTEKVASVVRGFGGKACLTSPKQPSGADRVAEVINPIDTKIVVNIQGDEPMISGLMIDGLITALLEEKEAQMATLIKKIKDTSEIFDPNIVKVVLDRKGYAIYFSRSPIPYDRRRMMDEARDIKDKILSLIHHEPAAPSFETVYYKHIGLYAYTKDFLFTFINLPMSKLEKAEKLEQLRALENGFKIKTVETEFDTIGVDTPLDLKRVKKLLENKNAVS